MRLYYWLCRLRCRGWYHKLWTMPDGRVWCYDEGRRVG